MRRKGVRVSALAVLFVAAASAVALGGAGGRTQARAATAAPDAPPRLAVIMAVDGLSWPRLTQYRPLYTAGLKRLLDEGLVATNARYRHLNTETGPGHASLATGAPPRVHGIVANRWFETGPDGKLRQVYCTNQTAPAVPGNPPLFFREVAKDGRLFVFADQGRFRAWETSGDVGAASVRIGYGPNGETVTFDSDDAVFLYDFRHGEGTETFTRGTQPGPANLRVDTLGDRLVQTYPAARVVSVSAKDRAAIYLAGRSPRHVAYWYDPENGRFTTSTAYDATTPAGAIAKTTVAAFNKSQAGAQLIRRFGVVWHRLLPVPAGSGAAPADELADFQVPVNGLLFDHDLGFNRNGTFAAFYVSPFVDELTADLAVTLVADPSLRLGRGPAPDLLAISFSAQDTVSHNYGPESEENLDVLRRLDVQVGRVLTALDAAVGRSGYVVGFSADHGFAPIPEHEKQVDPAAKGGRLVEGPRVAVTATDRLNRALDEALCLDPALRPVAAIEGWTLFYARPLAMRTVAGTCGDAGRLVGGPELDAVLPRTIAALFGEEIASVYLTSGAASWPTAEPMTEFVRNDFDPERSGDALLVPRPGVLMHWDPGRGTGHGSPYETDIHVPLILLGSAFPAGSVEADATPYDLAPTLAALVGVTLPAATGHSLRTPTPPAQAHDSAR